VVIATSTADEAARFEQSFRTLYTSEVLIVLRYLRANVADPAEAEELCAEAFLRAWVAWPRFRGQPGEARPWLLRIARNLVIDRHRRRRLLRIFPLRQQDSTGRDPTASEAINRVHFQQALGRLSMADRDLLALRAAGLSHAVIARVQGRGEDAVKMASHRALRRLRSQLEGGM
jgi:RNA polymerase sigma-70 factor (ECF subfamily)